MVVEGSDSSISASQMHRSEAKDEQKYSGI
jgi:hypothetical protein